jgi:uncharacterized membrane protein
VKLVRGVLLFGGLLPWLRTIASPVLPVPLKLSIDQAFAALCHHWLERTLVLGVSPMCVCSRCAGFYAGVALAALWPTSLTPSPHVLRRALEAGLVLMATDILTQDLGLHAPLHLLRLVSGAWVGGALAAWMLAEIAPQRFSATLSRADRSASRRALSARNA